MIINLGVITEHTYKDKPCIRKVKIYSAYTYEEM